MQTKVNKWEWTFESKVRKKGLSLGSEKKIQSYSLDDEAALLLPVSYPFSVSCEFRKPEAIIHKCAWCLDGLLVGEEQPQEAVHTPDALGFSFAGLQGSNPAMSSPAAGLEARSMLVTTDFRAKVLLSGRHT